MSADPRAAAQKVADVIAAAPLGYWADEADVQIALNGVLGEYYPVMAEYRLGPRDRPDFLVDVDGVNIVVEVKVAGSRNPILRQLGRYAAHPNVDALVLASSRRTLLHYMPMELHSKPVAVALVGGIQALS